MGSSRSYQGLQHLIPADPATTPGIGKSSRAGMPAGRSGDTPAITESQCYVVDQNQPREELQRPIYRSSPSPFGRGLAPRAPLHIGPRVTREPHIRVPHRLKVTNIYLASPLDDETLELRSHGPVPSDSRGARLGHPPAGTAPSQGSPPASRDSGWCAIAPDPSINSTSSTIAKNPAAQSRQ